MLEALEPVIEEARPDGVIVYGDTNSTLAGAVAASNLHIRVAHVEAGLRSSNRMFPEETSRILTHHLSCWLFCPTDTAVANLRREGICRGVGLVGDVMHEMVVRFGTRDGLPPEWRALGVQARNFALATIHRAENADDLSDCGRLSRGWLRLRRTFP